MLFDRIVAMLLLLDLTLGEALGDAKTGVFVNVPFVDTVLTECILLCPDECLEIRFEAGDFDRAEGD